MPWHALARPSPALGLLSAVCQEAGLLAPTEYHSGLWFADFLLNRDDHALTTLDYTTVAEFGFPHAVGDWIFAGVLNRPDFGLAAMRDYATSRGIPLRTITAMQELAEEFIDVAVREVLASDPDLVGLSATFMQNGQAWRWPNGSSESGPMSRSCWVAATATGRWARRYTVNSSSSTWCSAARPTRRPAPAAHLGPGRRPADVSSHVNAELVVGPARGCWWGEHHHCTFCSLNGTGMTFRAKPPTTFAAELEYLVREHQVLDVTMVGDILEPTCARHCPNRRQGTGTCDCTMKSQRTSPARK